jgi:hypothetical protein
VEFFGRKIDFTLLHRIDTLTGVLPRQLMAMKAWSWFLYHEMAVLVNNFIIYRLLQYSVNSIAASGA